MQGDRRGDGERRGDEADSAPRRGRPRSIETTNAILESAYALMAATGLVATTIDAIARHSSVSKMTIYKWWPSREALLIDAFLHHAAQMLPLPPASSGTPAARARRHAAAYAEALQGEFGKVQLAVISECISKTGSAELFYARYLQFRRDALVDMIAAGQKDGSILAEGLPRGPLRRDLWRPVLSLRLRHRADHARLRARPGRSRLAAEEIEHDPEKARSGFPK